MRGGFANVGFVEKGGGKGGEWYEERAHWRFLTVKVDAAILIDVGLGDQVLELRVARVETQLPHDLTEFLGGDVA